MIQTKMHIYPRPRINVVAPNRGTGDRIFSSNGPRIWYTLPVNLNDITNTAKFKRSLKSHFYPHMPIGMDISLTVCLFVCVCVCTVTDFSAEDKASGVKFCGAVHRRSTQEMSHFGELCSHKSPKSTNRPARPSCNVLLLRSCDSRAYQVRAACRRRIGMCGYTAVPEDGRTCLKFSLFPPTERFW